MRRLLVLAATAALLAACGGDDSGGGATATTLGDDPTEEQCLEVMRSFMEAIEVPANVDPSDGLDEDEQKLANTEVEQAGESVGIDINKKTDPCEEALGGVTDEEFTELSKDVDPEVIAMLGALATSEFEEVGDSIN